MVEDEIMRKRAGTFVAKRSDIHPVERSHCHRDSAELRGGRMRACAVSLCSHVIERGLEFRQPFLRQS
jgi:hypothetical protein